MTTFGRAVPDHRAPARWPGAVLVTVYLLAIAVGLAAASPASVAAAGLLVVALAGRRVAARRVAGRTHRAAPTGTRPRA